ncbi:GumC family protein [Qipengyuania gelatinilytica]|uniref:non-specific protein-tyrosine kinase n=1 Tax=Qipengyuania gelatinilytica TaxID=2867231 RepID=A0ABX9A2P9_9SPHN|nr:polysaccharide biosynthesis tyrosine autokinase [Qipengyuania gelatinilytica]QZD95552.1 polysaccharide biosynthesis tyrosine autokinase [Qipengyuania gelatinilytica]
MASTYPASGAQDASQFEGVKPGRYPAETATDGDAFMDIDLRRVWAAIRRNLLPIAAILIIAVGLGVLVTLLMRPQYQAISQVLIEQKADSIIEDSETQAVTPYQETERFLQTQVDVIESRSLAERVVESEDLSEREEFYEAQGVEMPQLDTLEGTGYSGPEGLARYRRDTAIAMVMDGLWVTLPVDSRLVSIGFTSGNPRIAAEMSNSIAQNFIESNLARKFDSSAYAREFLAQQLEDARQKLEQSEKDLNTFSRAAGLIRVTGQGQNADQETTLSVTNDTLQQLNEAASLATAERIAAENVWQNVANQPISSIPQVLQNPAYSSLVRELSLAEARLADERTRHLDDHPNVQALQAQVDRIEQQLDQVGNSIKNSIRLGYEAVRDRENEIQAQVAQVRDAALDEQDRGVQYNVLKRVAETDRALYNTLLTRYNELNATAGATSNNVSMVDTAQVPRQPSSPNLIINLVVALLGGLIVAAGVVFLREQFDDVLRTPEDVENKLGVSLLGLIPMIQGENPAEDLEDPKSPVSESYQSLVTNLRYSTADGIPRTLTITSSKAGEGKTTTAGKLALEFAELGRTTLLIDADLRRPTLHRKLENRKQEGFTALLAGERTKEEVILPSGHPKLSYMTALPMPPDPAALLSSTRLDELIAELLTQYECVVFDAPPMLGLSDAPTLAAHTDAVIMVIDADSGHRGAVKAALRRLDMVRANVLGAVLTKFNPRNISGEYAYYGTDYYTYEHGSDEE